MKRFLSLLLPAALCLSVFAGCSASSAPASRASVASQAFAGEKSAMDAAGLSDEAEKTAAAAPTASQAPSQNPAADSRKVVKSAELVLQTVRYDEAAAKFESLVGSFGGYIESSSVQGTGAGDDDGRSAVYTVRVAANRLDEFLNGAGALGTVVSKGLRGEDVTQSYFDSETRLKTLRTEQDRILTLMQKADKIEDVITIEQRLTEVENEIEQLTGELKRLDSLISLSTVTVTINEVSVITSPQADGLGGQLASMLRTSVSALGRLFRYLLLALTAALPFLAVAAVVAAAVLLVRRRIRKKKG